MVLPLWYRLTWVVPEKGPVSLCVCACACRSLICVWACCRFPSDETLRRQWEERLGRGDDWRSTDTARLCSAHFEEKCIYRTLARVSLWEGSMPTLFDFPPHLHQYTPKARRGAKTVRSAASLPHSRLPVLRTIYVNNNNNHGNVYGAVIMTKVNASVHPVHLMNAD